MLIFFNLSRSHALKIKQSGETASVWKFTATGSLVPPKAHQGDTKSEHKGNKIDIISIRILFGEDTGYVLKKFLEKPVWEGK